MKTPYELTQKEGEVDSAQDVSEAEEIALLKKLLKKYEGKV